MSFLLDLINRIEQKPPEGWYKKPRKKKKIKQVRKFKACPRCKLRRANTRDHTVPQALGKMCVKYGVKMDVHFLSKKNITPMCDKCNGEKGHKIETNDAIKYKFTLLHKFYKGEIYLTSHELNILRGM